ncbi:MAG TPA: hypothetical protein VMT10_12185 [Solirubrobacteraceae bacterium]|nr:hypothetical protein [Solirubrobacteraceae bacterium]
MEAEAVPETGGAARSSRRGAERDSAIRAELQPLAPDERPGALVAGAATASALAILNVLFYAIGVDVRGAAPSLAGVLLFAAIMLLAAWGMWTKRYWAVLGFQALLAVSLVIAGLSIMVAGNLAAVALCLGVLVFGGWLFWKLVRVLARLGVPRPGA